jgi:hypothetical protein
MTIKDKVVFRNDGEINSSRELRYEKKPLIEEGERRTYLCHEIIKIIKKNASKVYLVVSISVYFEEVMCYFYEYES